MIFSAKIAASDELIQGFSIISCLSLFWFVTEISQKALSRLNKGNCIFDSQFSQNGCDSLVKLLKAQK